jgi:hypothetical protein
MCVCPLDIYTDTNVKLINRWSGGSRIWLIKDVYIPRLRKWLCGVQTYTFNGSHPDVFKDRIQELHRSNISCIVFSCWVFTWATCFGYTVELVVQLCHWLTRVSLRSRGRPTVQCISSVPILHCISRFPQCTAFPVTSTFVKVVRRCNR